MKRRFFTIVIIALGLLVIPIVYINSSVFIINQEWKYNEGTHIGDFLDKKNFEIKDRVIYSYQGKAKIVFSLGFDLVIRDFETNRTGVYSNRK
jgi:hypothetical protein